ncbi:Crp/Fnr family transcriptional regulator [Fibrivirga algicola]|nr:Crp/Fnr family transcriptional regulator [Fibrivirga algicola]
MMIDALSQAALRLRQQISYFAPLTDDEWNALVPHLSIRTFRKHQCLIQQGEMASQVAFVLDGLFRQFYMKDGDERTTYFFLDDQLVGAYMSCVTGQPSLVTIEALSDSTCLAFPYTALTTLFSQYDGWQLFGRRFAEYIMVSLEERMVGLLTRSPEERYLDLLTGNQRALLQKVPQHYIANYLGITPVSLSRIRNRVSQK